MRIIILTINILTNQKLLDRILLSAQTNLNKINYLLNNFK